MTKTCFARLLLTWTLVVAAGNAASGCATGGGGSNEPRVVHQNEPEPEKGGIPPDKQAEIQLLLQQRDPSTLRCYTSVLNDKHDRAFKGNVALLLTLEPGGQASDVQIVTSTLNNKEVHDCLIEKIKEFEFPQLEHRGTMQYVYHFEPAY